MFQGRIIKLYYLNCTKLLYLKTLCIKKNNKYILL